MIIAILRIWLGLVLVVAGLAKFHHPDPAQRFLAKRVRPAERYSRSLVYGLSGFELLAGVALVAGLWSMVSAAVVLLLFCTSTLLVLRWKNASRDSRCGCFGVLDLDHESPRATLGRNVGLAVTALAVLIGEYVQGDVGWSWPMFAVALTLFVSSVFMYVLFLGTPDRGHKRIAEGDRTLIGGGHG